MKFLVLLLAIIAFSNCEDLQVVVKNFEAKINSLLAAKNFDGLSEYLEDRFFFSVNDINGESIKDFINYLRNGTFEMFNLNGPNDVIQIHKNDMGFGVSRDGVNSNYIIIKENGTEFGYLMATYYAYYLY